MVQAIVTDVEGTTSSLSFVKDVLFPYASAHLAEFVRAHAEDPEVHGLLEEARAVAGGGLDNEALVERMQEWIATDRKVTPLKALQGLIWEAGYREGAFTGHVYEDAAQGLRDWHARGLRLYVYSSGSVQAQKLLFAHTDYGDLTPLFSGYFDTHIGGKRETDSYRRIAETLGLPPGEILFLSDVQAELDAARAAGLKTVGLVREGVTPAQGHPLAQGFGDVELA